MQNEMTPEQEAIANGYLAECRAYNEQLAILLADTKWNHARLDVLLEKLREGINTQEEFDNLDRERRQIMQRQVINMETKAKPEKQNEELAIKINPFFGKKIW